jgi:hypothetical protein
MLQIGRNPKCLTYFDSKLLFRDAQDILATMTMHFFAWKNIDFLNGDLWLGEIHEVSN